MQRVVTIVIHQEPDGPSVHAEDGYLLGHEPVHGLQHETVTAECDNHIGLRRRDVLVPGLQACKRAPRLLILAGGESEFESFCAAGGHEGKFVAWPGEV